ncbi:MAG: hypothetical protein WC384_15590 [Prolixibacteraceae bacterium]
MKTLLFIKVVLLLPVMLFVDYVIMILFGSISQLLGFGDDFFCGTFCNVGETILGITVVLFVLLIFKELKAIFSTWRSGAVNQ